MCGRSSGEGNGNPLQTLAWKNPVDRGTCRLHRVHIVHRVSRSWIRLSTQARIYICVCVCVYIYMFFFIFFSIMVYYRILRAAQVVLVIKNLPANAGDM